MSTTTTKIIPSTTRMDQYEIPITTFNADAHPWESD